MDIIDRLESVQVDVWNRELGAGQRRYGNLPVDQVIEQGAIRQAAQGIMRGLVLSGLVHERRLAQSSATSLASFSRSDGMTTSLPWPNASAGALSPLTASAMRVATKLATPRLLFNKTTMAKASHPTLVRISPVRLADGMSMATDQLDTAERLNMPSTWVPSLAAPSNLF